MIIITIITKISGGVCVSTAFCHYDAPLSLCLGAQGQMWVEPASEKRKTFF